MFMLLLVGESRDLGLGAGPWDQALLALRGGGPGPAAVGLRAQVPRVVGPLMG